MYRSSDIYEDIVKVIIEIYRDYDIKDFPIDEKDICRRLGVALVPYSELPKEARALLEKKSKYGFFVRGTKENPPTIYYNDKFEPYGAVRLTMRSSTMCLTKMLMMKIRMILLTFSGDIFFALSLILL